jgi:hypothetical protein
MDCTHWSSSENPEVGGKPGRRPRARGVVAATSYDPIEHTLLIEPLSLDEAYLDLTEKPARHHGGNHDC